MLQSASKVNEHQLLAVAEHNTRLPQIAAKEKPDRTALPEKPPGKQCLPPIADKSGKCC